VVVSSCSTALLLFLQTGIAQLPIMEFADMPFQRSLIACSIVYLFLFLLASSQFGSTVADKNLLKNIGSRAFDDVKACYIDLRNLKLQKIASESFRDVRVSFDLEMTDNKIRTIEENAFLRIDVRNLYLTNNAIQAITVKMFGDSGSTIRAILGLTNNEIQTLHEDSLKGVTVNGQIRLRDNKLVLFPSKALERQDPRVLELRNNQIPSIPVGWLDSFKNLRQL